MNRANIVEQATEAVLGVKNLWRHSVGKETDDLRESANRVLSRIWYYYVKCVGSDWAAKGADWGVADANHFWGVATMEMMAVSYPAGADAYPVDVDLRWYTASGEVVTFLVRPDAMYPDEPVPRPWVKKRLSDEEVLKVLTRVETAEREVQRWKLVASYLADCHAATLEGMTLAPKKERARQSSTCAHAASYLEGSTNPLVLPGDTVAAAIRRCKKAVAKYGPK